MGNGEEGKSCKPEKPNSPAPDQANTHVYPDWPAMQAYYGARVAMPPFFSSAVASGHAPPPYMWPPPQPIMPPYAAIYAHGGVYAHPGVPLGGVLSAPAASEAMVAATTLSMDMPAKSSGKADCGLLKKLKGFDGLAMSIGNSNGDNPGGETEHSHSEETDGSTDGSDTGGGDQNDRKRSREETPNASVDRKAEPQSMTVPSGHGNGSSEKVMDAGITPNSVAGKAMTTVLSPCTTTALELMNPSSGHVKTSPTGASQPVVVMPNEPWSQDERELKRERRKQSNRESARRSRLRKQAETEELAAKVESLTAENTSLKSEISRLTENSEKLKHENAQLTEKMKVARKGQEDHAGDSNRVFPVPVYTENLLSRVNNNSGSGDRNNSGEGEVYDKKSGAKLHQLLNANPRTDAVAAG